MINIIFILFSHHVLSDSPNEEYNNHLIIDFGGKYLKGGLLNLESTSLSFLNRSKDSQCISTNDCYSIPNSISASITDFMFNEKSEDAVKIGTKAFDNAAKNKMFGIQYFGAIFNRKRSFISKNCNLFNLDTNVTNTEFPIFWYLIQFFLKYKKYTSANQLTVVLPGYSTSLTSKEMKVANNNSFVNLTIVKDYEIIQRVHSNLFTNNRKNILYLDFGAFSTKATVVNKENEIISYEFNEECGIELVAYRQARQIFDSIDEDSNNYGNYVFKARNEAYNIISNESFYDDLFEQNLKKLIDNSISNSKSNTGSDFVIDEIILIGGGCELPFVQKALEKVLNGKKFDLIEKVTNDIQKLNHITFFVEGCLLPPYNNSKSVFIYHPLFVKYDDKVFKIEDVSNLNKKPFNIEFKMNLGNIEKSKKDKDANHSILWNNKIEIVTDKDHVVGGMSIKDAKFVITNLDSKADYSDKFIVVKGSLRSDDHSNAVKIDLDAQLCDDGESNNFDCKIKLDIEESNSTLSKIANAEKRASELDAAMGLIRMLSGNKFGKKKDKDEL